jgi:hypothetical protein
MSDPSNSTSSSLNQAIAKVKPVAQKAWVSARPTLVTLLKGTIGTLQTAVTRLETQIQQDGSTAPSLDFTPVQKVANTFWEKTQPLWLKIITFLRTKLPQDINTQLSDRGLSGILAGFLLLFLWITSSIGGSAPTPRKPVTSVPQVRPAPVRSAPVPTAPVKPAPNITQQFPADLTQANKQPFPSDLSQPGTTPVPQPATPAPVAPSTPPVVASKPAPIAPPKPTPILTPEQKLLVKLQENITAYGDNLAQAVRPNQVIGQLKVTLANDWYQLSPEKQDQLASALLSQAQTLKFKSLELMDSKDNLLARSPIVGDEMVILLRHIS